MELFLETIKSFFDKIISSPISELTILEILISLAALYILVVLVYRILKVIILFIKKVCKVVKISVAAGDKCKKIQCTTCGRTLDKCVCKKNQGRSNLGRLMLYKRELKNKKK